MKLELAQQIAELQQGDHLCLFYEKDPAEQMPALVPFIQEGLSRDEQFIYIADDQTVEEFACHLQRSGINVPKERRADRLKLWTREEWRQAGELDSERKALQVRKFIDEAAQSGFKGIRFAVEMTWTLGPDITAAALEHWEATINTLVVPGVPARIICQYNQSRLAPQALQAALHTHPLAIIGEHVCPNLFYQAHLILDGHGNGDGHADSSGHAASARVNWMVSQLKRARAAEIEREELIRQREELRSSESRLRQLVALMPAAVYTCDEHGLITFFNRQAAELWGREPQLNDPDEKFCGSFRLWRPDGSPLPHRETPMAIAVKTGRSTRHEEVIIERPDGSRLIVNVNIEPLYDAHSRRCGAINVFQDVSDRHHIQEALKTARAELQQHASSLEQQVAERTAELTETNSQLEAFVYSVAHDLRSPLRSMQAFSTMLLDEYAVQLDETAQNYVRRIMRSAESMDALVLDLLAYGRAARSDTPLTTVSVETAWQTALGQNELAIREKNACIETTLPLPLVRAHETTLGQVLANLLSNAVKFVRPDKTPQVRLWFQETGNVVRLWVEDNGIGIAAEHQERVFRAFERLHGKEFSGTGIGLSIVRKGVERMGGSTGVESTVDEGSRFWIELLKG
jgi:signal transduction histidine kinase